MVIYSLTC
jgi:hypothetical protein